MAKEVEILVHITAPSTSKDDAAYRALASAYLDFVPDRKTELAAAPEALSHIHAAPPAAELESPQASFRSVWGNIRPSAAGSHSQEYGQSASQQHGSESQDSWVQPPSEVEDSMPDNDISMAAFTTPTRVLNYYLQTMHQPLSESSQEVVGTRESTFDEGIGDVTMALAHDGVVAEDGNEDGSNPPAPAVEQESILTSDGGPDEVRVTQVPSSPLQLKGAPPPQLSFSKESRVRSPYPAQSSQELRSVVDDVIIPSTQPLERADSAPPLSKRHKPNPPIAVGQALSRSISDVLPRGAKQLMLSRHGQPDNMAAGAGLQNTDWSDTVELVSAEPPAANHRLEPRAPVYLQDFCEKFSMKNRYRPHFQAREMQPFERGYWALDMDGWPHEAKVETWGFLGNFIRRDNGAGWGTRACRDGGWRWIRLYGWEHIAGELYILLYVASYRRLKLMEVSWYDGAGEVLVIMGPRGNKSILD
ncbi:hypothetical protein M406DRAFT_352734 [Cryphonectria parasitica EP155]|uniref:Uncharacterized protein n=1 Tax=Cryphonectria parasitica (strain ATCC 38755 / EP155) TaxID=660469 RepID=A0A9P4XX23_CRYP1|nr:uncharacterized protein M406DRAFT_352734 [Cryphonectria parasitica EP155]KAF3762387.1 hypothetical protein M406DRAFT_352734 [Cryphonectria parasitica EP155]